MSAIDATIIIDADEDMDISRIVSLIQSAISSLNGENTKINVIEIDNPSSFSPLALKQMRDKWQ